MRSPTFASAAQMLALARAPIWTRTDIKNMTGLGNNKITEIINAPGFPAPIPGTSGCWYRKAVEDFWQRKAHRYTPGATNYVRSKN